MNFGLSTSVLQTINKVFASFPQIEEVILFGSRAMGNYKSGSDIDLALKGDLNAEIVSNIHAILEEKLPIPYFFDLVDYDHLDNPKLKEHIDNYGKVMFQKLID